MRWKEYENIDSQIIWLSAETFKLPTGEPYKLGVRLRYTEHLNKEWAKRGKYCVSVHIVSPAFSRKAESNFRSTLCSMSTTECEFSALQFDHQCGLLIEAGMSGEIPTSQIQSDNLKSAVKTAKEFANDVPPNIKSYLKDCVNQIGATVQNWMQGIFDPKRIS